MAPKTKIATEETNQSTDAATAEVVSGEVVPATQTTAVATAKDKPAFTLKRRVTLELFKTVPGVECYYKVEGPIYQGKPIKESGAGAKKEPAFLMNVTDLQSGVMGQIIVGSVLKSTLLDEYPDESYVGKCFAIKMRKVSGKNYNGYDIAEIELNPTE